MHCSIHQVTPAKLGLGGDIFPPTKSLTCPTTHTFCPSPSRSLPLISQLGLWHAPALFCVGGALGLMGGRPRLTRWIQVQPEATGSRGCRWAIFLVLSPFEKVLSSFSVNVGVVEVIREPAGRPERAPQTGAILLSKVGLKWEGGLLWLMKWNDSTLNRENGG